MIRSALTSTFVLLLAAGACAGDLTTITFDELPFQPVDDVQYAGVSFDYKINGVDSADAHYASFGPGTLTYVSDPSLTGNAAGDLTLRFAVPTPILEFGAALNPADALSRFTVALFDES